MICAPASTAARMPAASAKESARPESSPTRIEMNSAAGATPAASEATAVPWPLVFPKSSGKGVMAIDRDSPGRAG